MQLRKATKITLAALFQDTHTKTEKLTVNTVYQT